MAKRKNRVSVRRRRSVRSRQSMGLSNSRRHLQMEKLEPRFLLASAWQNPFNNLDVRVDGIVVSFDVLSIINELNSRTIVGPLGQLPDRNEHPNAPFWDSTGDDLVSPSDVLAVINGINFDVDAPVIRAQLENDTAPAATTNDDRITSDALIAGEATDRLGVRSLKARVDGGVAQPVAVQPSGGFLYDPGFAMNGSDDGLHTITFVATDPPGHVSESFEFLLLLDTTSPSEALITLDPTGATELGVIDVRGQTEPRSDVTLIGSGRTIVSNGIGVFGFQNVALDDGPNDLEFRISDVAGNSIEAAASITKFDTTPPTIVASLVNDTGFSATDSITSDHSISGLVGESGEIVDLRASLDDGTGDLVSILETVQTDGRFELTEGLLESIRGGPLDNGFYTLRLLAEDARGNTSLPFSLPFTLDTLAPTAEFSSPIEGALLERGSTLAGTVDGSGSPAALVEYRFDDLPDRPLAVDNLGRLDREIFISEVSDGAHILTVTATDLAGNQATTAINVTVDTNSGTFAVASHTPVVSADEVGVTFKPQVSFSHPIDELTLNSDNFFATYSGSRLPATVVPSGDGRFAWLFFEDQLPAAATISVTADGNTILSRDGRMLDGDGDGNPGGELRFTFSTVGLQKLPGTSLTGVVMDPGPDLQPHTADDTTLEGVEVTYSD